MIDPYVQIIHMLDEARVDYETIEHEPVFTSEQAAAVRGLSIEQGAKSLLFKTKEGEFVLTVMPGNKRADSKALKALLHTKSLRFATPEEVMAQMGCAIGSCYPFGVVVHLQTLIDPSLGHNTTISFNPGRHDRSITLAYKDYERLAQGMVVQITML